MMQNSRYKVFTAATVIAVFAFASPVKAQPYGPGMGGGYGPGYGMMGGGYGPGMMGGYGPGMMGGGYGPGWMMGPGMMGGYGPGYGPGMMGGGYGPGMMGGYGPGYGPGMMGGYGPGYYGRQGNLNLSTDDVKTYLERMLAFRGNARLKVGEVKEKDGDTIVADIVTKDKEAVVQRFAIDRRTGFFRPEEN
jgi:hypothetical protein